MPLANSRQLFTRQEVEYTMRANNGPQNDHGRIVIRHCADMSCQARGLVSAHHRERGLGLLCRYHPDEASLVRHIERIKP